MTDHDAPWTLDRDVFDLDRIRYLKAATTVAVVIPARNEAATIGAVLDDVLRYSDLVNELIVVNDHSNDDTATVASLHGARVVALQGPSGKGEAMAAGFTASHAQIVVFLDADVLNSSMEFVPRLIQPLLERPHVQLVKGFYERPLLDMPTGGGRVNELAARPILSLLFPGLGEIRQPLAGETAVRREALESIVLASGYQVEIALLIDVARAYGVHAVAQVDLGVRRHRNRPLEELNPMAVDVLRVVLERYAVTMPRPG